MTEHRPTRWDRWDPLRHRVSRLASVQTLLIITVAAYGVVCGVSLLIL